MKYKDIQSKSPADLTKLLQETELELIKENSQVAAGTIPKNPGKISVLRRTISKVKQLQGKKAQ
jgi:large subunit ribosomal protein L29